MGNTTATIILHALLTMTLCLPVGLVVGSVLQRVNERTIAQYKQRNPMTAESAKGPGAGAAAVPPNAAAHSDHVSTQPERNVSATPVA